MTAEYSYIPTVAILAERPSLSASKLLARWVGLHAYAGREEMDGLLHRLHMRAEWLFFLLRNATPSTQIAITTHRIFNTIFIHEGGISHADADLC